MSTVISRAAGVALALVAVGCGRSAPPTEPAPVPPSAALAPAVVVQQPSGGQLVAPGRPEQLLRNPGFEQVPQEVVNDQGFLPSEWVQCTAEAPNADTYSNDGSWGLSPDDRNNFTGLVAAEGKRWAAGAHLGELREAFGQKLTRPLQSGAPYRFSAQVLESPNFGVRATFELVLSPSAAYDAKGAVSLGKLEPTTGVRQWEPRALAFAAPQGAEHLPYFVLIPRSSDGTSQSYIGIDDLSLTAGQ